MRDIDDILNGPPVSGEREEDEILEAVGDYFDNGGANPVTHRDMKLILAGVRKTYRVAASTTTIARSNRATLWAVITAFTVVMGIFFAVRAHDLALITSALVALGAAPPPFYP